MEALIAERTHPVGGTLDERLSLTKQDDGKFDIDLRYWDREAASPDEEMVARTFCTLPHRVMVEIAQKVMEQEKTGPSGTGSSPLH